MSNNFYDILINDKRVATVGPSSLKQLHISFGVMNGKHVIKAGGVSDQDDDLEYINWLEEKVDLNASLRVVPSKDNQVSSPIITKKLGQSDSTDEVNVCDFCNRTEQEVGTLISFGSSPLICEVCIKRCAETLKTKK